MENGLRKFNHEDTKDTENIKIKNSVSSVFSMTSW